MIALFRRKSRLFLLPCLFLTLFFTGCSVSPLLRPLPEGLDLKRIASVDSASPVAIGPAGEHLAYVRNGLYVHETATGRRVRLSDAVPTSLSWNPKGEGLYASFLDGEKSRIVHFDRDGRRVAETTLEGRVTDLACAPSGEVVALAISLKLYSFGGAYQAILYRWDGETPPVKTLVGDTSVNPGTLKLLGDSIYETARMDLSPLGDEVVITRLYDPPAFPPSIRSHLLHLLTGVKTEPLEIFRGGEWRFLPDGETLLFSDGLSEVLRVDSKSFSTEPYLSSAGEGLAVSPSGRFVFAGGILYGDRVEEGRFPPDSVACFSASGTMLLRHKRSLWLVSGLDETLPVLTLNDAEKETLLRYREWRSKGLITADEYQALRRNLEKP